jgi:D-alanyl-D-alanine carboxypeptidase
MIKMVAAHVVYDAIKAGDVRMGSTTRISAEASAFSFDRQYSNIRMAAGASVTIRQLLEFIIVRSACAATVALGEAVFGSEGAMVRRMNEKAAQLGVDAVFHDSWGGSPDNSITPLGMAQMTRALIEDHPEVLDIATMRSVTYQGTVYNNTNQMLGEYRGLDGLKTGFTTPAGYCFIGTAQRDGRRVIVVTMGSTLPLRFSDTRILLDYGFAVADRKIAEYEQQQQEQENEQEYENEQENEQENEDGQENESENGQENGQGLDAPIAHPSSANLILDGLAMPLPAYLIEGAHYFRLRDVAYLLSGTAKQFGIVSWDPETSTAILLSGLHYDVGEGGLIELDGPRPYAPTSSIIFFDGVECDFEIYLIDGFNYFKLRDLAILMDFFVYWIDATRTVIIETSVGYEYAA